MSSLLPLAIAIPLLTAAAIVAMESFLSRRFADAAALAASLAVAAFCAAVAFEAMNAGLQLHWAGGWLPRDGTAIGIALVADGASAALACLGALLASAAFLYSWHYFETATGLFHALLLCVLAGIVGFCFSGDLFTLFVFFELTAVPAYALTGHQIERAAPIQGAFHFAVVTSIAAFLMLMGVALLYGRTGALNLAEVGRSLAAEPPDALVVTAWTLIAGGLLVKAGLFPFHFAHADAHTVAPVPVLVPLSGILLQLGIYGVARLYWTVFAGSFDDPIAVRHIFVWAGALAAFLAGAMCFLQRHLNRMLAFSSLSHLGLLVIGFGLVTSKGVAGMILYILSHGLVKGSLFLSSGLLLHRLGSIDELELRGRGRSLPFVGVLFVLAALGLAGLPSTGVFLAKSLMEESAGQVGLGSLSVVLAAAAILPTAALVRAAGRIFLGWGAGPDRLTEESRQEATPRETEPSSHPIPWVMLAPPVLLLSAGLALGLLPAAIDGAEAAAHSFTDVAGYTAAVLEAERVVHPIQPGSRPKAASFGLAALSCLGAIALAALALFPDRLQRARRRLRLPQRGLAELARPLRVQHSGDVRDYVAWLVLGMALFGAISAAAIG